MSKPDWAAVHSELAAVYERHGLQAQANIHRRLAVAHEAARTQREAA